MARILIVEDDEAIAELERDYLEVAGHEARVERNGRTGLTLALSGDYDLVLLDVMLPGMDGMDVCRVVRESAEIPVIMVTARTAELDAVRGLGLGADDYVRKPFSPSELVARVNACLDRYARLRGELGEEVIAGPLRMDTATRRVSLGGRELELRAKEFDLLLVLARNPGVVYSREALYERVWGIDGSGDDSTVTVHIKRLRGKLGQDPAHPTLIQTVRGVGYRLSI